MDTLDAVLQDQLFERRRRLESAIGDLGGTPDLVRLLQEVDAALKRVEVRSYGECEVCHLSIEERDLAAHPLIPWCLCDLTPAQQEVLQRDLQLASRIQWALLPMPDLTAAGWDTHYRYLPMSPVGGDYCDVVADGSKGLYFVVGDVMGHGVAASFLMARLNALFRSVFDLGLPLTQIVERTNKLFQDRASAEHYATLVCGRADDAGRVELVNAGHCRPLAVRAGRVEAIEGAGLPVGLLEPEPYTASRIDLSRGDTLLLYTDGVIEAQNAKGEFFGEGRLAEVVAAEHALPPRALAAACLEELHRFRGDAPLADDLTMLVLRRGSA